MKAKLIQPGKRTVAVMGSKPSDMFVPGWDDVPGHAQHQNRLDERRAMGQKMTPLTRGTLKKG